jgi:hypothetical protein
MELLIEYPIDETAPLVIRKLLNFEISKELRRNLRTGQPGEGFGRRAIEALARSIPEEIEILDIKAAARGFWANMGVKMYQEQRRVNGKLKPAITLDNNTGSRPRAGRQCHSR